MEPACSVCRKTGRGIWHWHHIDGNPQNNNLDNLILYCDDCIKKRAPMRTTPNPNPSVPRKTPTGKTPMETEHIAGDVWRVKSETANKWYNVDLAVPNCTCTDWATKRNKRISQGLTDFYQCKHVIAAKDANVVLMQKNLTTEEVDARAEEIMAKFRRDETEEKANEIIKRFSK